MGKNSGWLSQLHLFKTKENKNIKIQNENFKKTNFTKHDQCNKYTLLDLEAHSPPAVEDRQVTGICALADVFKQSLQALDPHHHEDSNQAPNKGWPQLLSQVCLTAARKIQVSFPPLFIDSAPLPGS